LICSFVPPSPSLKRVPPKHRSLSLGFVSDFTQAYNEVLISHPVLTKSITAGIILGLADVTTQTISSRMMVSSIKSESEQDAPLLAADTLKGGEAFSFPRFLRFVSLGALLIAPWNHYYYSVLDAAIPPTDNPFSATNLAKVGIDQFVQAPFFTAVIIMYLNVFSGMGLQEAVDSLKNQYEKTMLDNWKLWIPATFVNIGFIDPNYR